MSLSGSVVIYPRCQGQSSGLWGRLFGREGRNVRSVGPPADLEATARGVLGVLEDLDLIDAGVASSAAVDNEPTFATSEVLEGVSPPGLRWVHLAVEPVRLRPSLGQLVYTATAQEWWGDSESEVEPDAIAVPHLDVTCLSRPISVTEAGARIVATSWLFLEFNYDDASVSDEIHTIRDPNHPLFRRLGSRLKAPAEWTVVVG